MHRAQPLPFVRFIAVTFTLLSVAFLPYRALADCLHGPGLDEDADSVTCETDCDDGNPHMYPGHPEIPRNGRDDDCNPATRDDYPHPFIIITSDDSRLYFAKSNGDGTWSDFRLLTQLSGTIRGAAIADFDNDGYLDFLVGSPSSNTATYYLFANDGTDQFTRTTVGTVTGINSYQMAMTAGDFNHDGNMDFLSDGNERYVHLGMGDGRGGFTITTLNTGLSAGRAMDTADFNGDGHLDYLRAVYNSGQVTLYLGDGAGGFTSAGVVADPGDDPYGLAAGDFDGDGHADFIVNSGGGGDPYFRAGNGDGTFKEGVYVASLDFGNHGAYAGYDFNGDGKLDIVATSYSSHLVRFYPGNGDGTFGSAVPVGSAYLASNQLGIASPPLLPPAGDPVAFIEPASVVSSPGAMVNFSGAFSQDNGSITAYSWDFGDGAKASGATVSHTFPAAEGDYVVRLTVTDDTGKKHTAATHVILKGQKPVAVPGGPYTFGESFAVGGVYTVPLDGSASTDDKAIIKYEWDFGDGWSDDFGDGNADGWSFPNAGTWSVDTGALLQANQSPDRAYALSGSHAGGDYTLEADVRITGGGGQEVQVIARAQDWANNYEFILRGRGYNDVLIARRVDNSWTQLIDQNLTFTPALDTTYHLKIECRGSQLRMYVDGNFVAEATDTTFTHGMVGLSTYRSSARFDNVVLTSAATGDKPTHAYGLGTFPVTLTVIDAVGQTDTKSTTVTLVTGAPPVARPGGPYAPDEHQANCGNWTVTFDGSASSDDAGASGIYRYTWDFGDGTATGSGFAPSHTFAGNDPRTVTLTVTDNALQTHAAATTMTPVPSDPPVARPGGPYEVDEQAATGGLWEVIFDGSASSDDVGLCDYQWDFGDGTSGTGATPSHQYAAAGDYTVTLTVRDHALQSHAATTTVTVLDNAPPVADAGPARVTEVGLPVTLDATGSTDDFGIWKYQWDFGVPAWSTAEDVQFDAGEAIVLGKGSWGTEYLVTDQNFTRNSGDSYTGRIRVQSGGNRHVMWGLKNTGTDYNYNQFYYAIYFNNNSVYIYESGASRGSKGTFLDNTSYDLRIDVKATGATYYYRQTGAAAWITLYDSTFSNASPFRLGATVNSGTIFLKDFTTPAGPYPLFASNRQASLAVPQVTYLVPGTYHPQVTVTDDAHQTNTAATTVTVLPGSPPVANTGGPYYTNEDIPTRFNARASTDDFGIAAYTWDFGDGEGITTKNFWVDHRYTTAGTYTATLTVTDYSGKTASASTSVNVNADPVVACVPWAFSGSLEVPHDTWSGKEATLKAVAWSLHTPLTYEWTFGDGSPATTGTVTDKRTIETKHTYTGVEGQTFIATLTITDADGRTATDQYFLRIQAKSLDIEINKAIDDGLWWLHRNQNQGSYAKGTYGNTPVDYGTWDNAGGYNGTVFVLAPTASAVQAFETNAHLELGNVRENPYVETVARGLRYIAAQLRLLTIGTQTYGDPDTNHNGIGVEYNNASDNRPAYEVGQAMDALIASGSRSTFAITGPAGVSNRSYFELVWDMADTYFWAQSDDATVGGGWRYTWNQAPDNSAAQWGAIGLLAAERVWGIKIPQWVRDRNNVWLSYSYNGTGFGYAGNNTGEYSGTNTTPSGMVQLAFDNKVGYDDPATAEDDRDPRWKTAENWFSANWNGSAWYPNASTNNRFTYYGYYAFTKAMRTAHPKPVVNLKATGLDWFKDDTRGIARRLVNRQGADGGWPVDVNPGGTYVGYDLTNAWSVLILTPTLFVQPPVADAGEDRVWGVDVPITLDGSRSYHLDPARHIVLYEWDVDGDGIFDSVSDQPKFTYTYSLADYPELPKQITVTLKVTDDNDPPSTDTDTMMITLAIPPHPPVANAGGPYTCTAGIPCRLDGSHSFDIDPTDFITSWEWDLDNDAVYTDATGEKPLVTFPAPGMFHVGLRVLDNAVMNDVNGNGVQDPEERKEDFDFTTATVLFNNAPTAKAGGPYTVTEGAQVTLDGSESFDPDGNPISYTWDLDNDGAYDDASGVTTSFTGLDDGDYPVGLSVSDALLAGTATATVAVVNVAPTVNAGADVTIHQGETVTLAPATFTDPGTADTHTASISWGDGATSTGTVNEAGGSGTVAGAHTFTQIGTFTLTVTVTDDDSGAGSDILTVTVKVPDTTPPDLVGVSPANGSTLEPPASCGFVLYDNDSAVNDAQVKALSAVFDRLDRPVAGTFSEVNDAFTFTPSAPFTHGLYRVAIAAVDNAGNRKDYSFSFTVVPRLDNPSNVVATPMTGYAELTWAQTAYPEYFKEYRVYVSQQSFTNVTGMTPRLVTTTPAANVAGLADNTTYFFAVTAVNLVNGETKTVFPTSATMLPDRDGPTIESVKLDGVPLTNGAVLTKPQTVSVKASDPAGMSRVEFTLDGSPYQTDSSGPDYTSLIDILPMADGPHTLVVTAYDSLDNSTARSYNITTELAVPTAAPVITQPANGLQTSQAVQTAKGNAPLYTSVQLYLNGTVSGTPTPVDGAGNFTAQVTLTEDENLIEAAALNRAGTGPKSAGVHVTLDTALPKPPASLTAEAKAGGVVKLLWQTPANTNVKGYNLYRATNAFTTTADAVKVNASLIMSTGYEHLTPADGTYHFRMTSVNPAGVESALSNEAVVTSDSIPPEAVSLVYATSGPFDPITGRMAPGVVDVTVNVNEPLLVAPFVSIAPEGGIPMQLSLVKQSDLVYTGVFVIEGTTPTGPAYVVFSARDLVGNRGTEIKSGGIIQLDTRGPQVKALTVEPVAPIKNDAAAPTSVTVTIALDEALPAGQTPALSYTLSKTHATATAITGLGEVPPANGTAQAWRAVFTLPATAGSTGPEDLKFAYQGTDDLGNTNTSISGTNLFQVYQGALPALPAPAGLTAKPQPAGTILLFWNPVPGAVDYAVYRQAPGESAPSLLARSGNAVTLSDQTPADGLYRYAVSSIRQENGQEAESVLSSVVEATSDSVPPGKPTALVLSLNGTGILAEWQPPAGGAATYSFYRGDIEDGAVLPDTTGLALVGYDIPKPIALDSYPSTAEHGYVVTAVDAAGNESAPSTAAYLNPGLLPVSTLTVTQEENAAPVVAWTHPGGSIAGFNLYLGEGSPLKLNAAPITDHVYTDVGYNDDIRVYTVTAVDDNGVESVGRSITLPKISAAPPAGETLSRGIMNRLGYEVTSAVKDVSSIQLKVEVESHAHLTELFSVTADTPKTVPVIVGGFADLPDQAQTRTTVIITPNPGEKVEIRRTGTIAVTNGALRLGFANEAFTRGGTGLVRFILENTSDVEVEVVIAENNNPSSEVTFSLLDQDGNILTAKPFKQLMGTNVVLLSSGKTVARIPAGATFTSEALDLPVPSTAPDQLTLSLAIKAIHYHLGRTDHVAIDGMGTRKQVSLIDTAYTGELLSISPQTSVGGEDIVITGRAVRLVNGKPNGQPMPNSALKLFITLNGFERGWTLSTDAAGNFSHTFTPPTGESGRYLVSVVHPDLLDRPLQGEFVVQRVIVHPQELQSSIPRNYEQSLAIEVSTGEATPLTNLRLRFDQADQPGGVFPQGVHLTPGEAVTELAANQTAELRFTVWGDNTAAEVGQLILRVVSDESATAWGTVTVRTQFLNAQPALFVTPDHVETGVTLPQSGQTSTATETVLLENRGLVDMYGVTLALLRQDGTPAPSWVYLAATAADQGSIRVGDKRSVTISFSPPASTALGRHDFFLRIRSDNHPTRDVGLYVTVTQSGIGGMLFKVEDIYTATHDASGNLIPGLAGATIRLQSERDVNLERTQSTDSVGESLFTDLPAGTYKYRVTAPKHQELIGRVWIKPGLTGYEYVFLGYDLVSLEWEVKEISIEDRYELLLKATYETNVPAAVVVAEPKSIPIPEMQPGDVITGEIRYTNYGLIKAENLRFLDGQSDQYYKFELLAALPETLGAKESITVPYRITCLKPFPGDNTGGGAGCATYANCKTLWYITKCSNGKTYEGVEVVCATRVNPSGGDGGGGGGGGSGDSGCPVSYPFTPAGGGGGGGTVPAARSNPLAGLDCAPKRYCPVDDECCKAAARAAVGSNVDLLMGEYTDEALDLALKVPGSTVRVERRFYENNWHFGHEGQNLVITAPAGGEPAWKLANTEITRDGVSYGKPFSFEGDKAVWKFGNNRFIESTDSGYRWHDTDSNWSAYEASGKLLASGGKGGGVTLLYEDPLHPQRLTGLTDGSGSQVLWYEYNAEGRLIAIADAAFRRVAYEYDTAGRMTRITDVLGKDTVYVYNGNGWLLRETDAAGRVKNLTYNRSGFVSSVTNAAGQGSFFDYNYDTGRQEYYAKVEKSTGLIRESWFDESGRLKRVAINGVQVQENLFTDNGRTSVTIDRLGRRTTVKHDEWDNPVKVVFADGTTRTFSYAPGTSRLARTVDVNGAETLYTYDDAGNLRTMTEAAGTGLARTLTFEYDAAGNNTTVMAAGGARTRMEYDSLGNMVKRIDPQDHVWEYTHDLMGNVKTVKDPRGNLWKYEYDAKGRITMTEDPLGRQTVFSYNGADNRTGITEMLQGSAVSAIGLDYDAFDNIVRITYQDGSIEEFEYGPQTGMVLARKRDGRTIGRHEYDSQERPVKNSDGLGNAITMTYADNADQGRAGLPASLVLAVRVAYPSYARELSYDMLDRLVEVREVLDETTAYGTTVQYDAAGNVVGRTDRNGKVTTYAYDLLNRLTTVTSADGGVTTYGYDGSDNLVSVTDGRGKTTRYEYDANNQRTKVIRPLGQETAYAYDGAGNRTEKLDADGRKAVFHYDGANRLVRAEYFAAGETTPGKTVTFTYDSLGRMTGYDDGTIAGAITYDEIGRKTGETVDYGPFVLSYAYTYDGILGKRTFTGPDGITYTYDYDAGGNLGTLIIPQTGAVTVNQYAWNGPEKITLPGGTVREYAYDPLARIAGITVKDPGQNLLMHYQYGYDPMGNITGKQTEHGTYAYSYDPRSRLTGIESPVEGTVDMTYDAAGNRTSMTGVSGAWQYDDNNRLVSREGADYIYNDSGNLIRETRNGQTVEYIYDVEGRLARVERDGVVLAEFAYDPMGRRVKKTAGGTTTYFLYSDEGLIGEYNGAGNQMKAYGYMPGGGFSQDPVFMHDGSGYSFFDNDHLGTPQKLHGLAGETKWSAEYEAFGKATVDSGATVENNLRFPGQYYDEETGLHYNYARDYDTENGRYVEFDPLLDEVYSPIFHEVQNENAYAYAGNRPTVKADPPGTSFLVACSAGLPVCSAAVFCSANFGACSGGIVCSANVGACSGSVLVCSANAGLCSGQAVGAGICSATGVGVCSAQATDISFCSATGAGACSGQAGLVGAGACSASGAGACSGQAGAIGASACSAMGAGACSAQAGGQVSYCSATTTGACSLQVGAGPGIAGCSGMSRGTCSAGAAVLGGTPDCSAVGAGACSGQMALGGSNGSCSAVGNGGSCSGQFPAGSCICFTGDTLVGTADGEAPIDSLAVGDLVLTMNPFTGEVEEKPVTTVFQRVSPDIYTVRFDNGDAVECTGEHPFWVLGLGWTPAHELMDGAAVVSINGRPLFVTGLEVRMGETPVFNIEIEDNNNYFVSPEQILVHNRCELRLR